MITPNQKTYDAIIKRLEAIATAEHEMYVAQFAATVEKPIVVTFKIDSPNSQVFLTCSSAYETLEECEELGLRQLLYLIKSQDFGLYEFQYSPMVEIDENEGYI